jgi:hypothetical protein
MNHREGKCGSCGETDWAEARAERYAAVAKRLRDLADDDDKAPPPDLVLTCQACGATRIVLSTTFHVADAQG